MEAEHAPSHVEELKHTIEVEAQIEDLPIGVIVPIPMVNVKVDFPPSNSATKKNVMMNVLNQRINILKRISQDAYNAFINLQFVEKMCKEAIGWLDPIFQQWGPYMQFFDRFIPFLAKKPNFPDKVIAVKRAWTR